MDHPILVIPENDSGENSGSLSQNSGLDRSAELENNEFSNFRKTFFERRASQSQSGEPGSANNSQGASMQRRSSISMNQGGSAPFMKRRVSILAEEEEPQPNQGSQSSTRRQSQTISKAPSFLGASSQPEAIAEEPDKPTLSRKQTHSNKQKPLVDLNQIKKSMSKSSRSGTFTRSQLYQRISPIARFRAVVEAVIKSKKATSIFVFKGPADSNDTENEDEEKDELEKSKNTTLFSHLTFNFEDFKARRTDKLTVHVKDVLKKAPEARTSLDLDLIAPFIQDMKAFSRHSASIKRELCKILKFETFGPGRNIVKQGHLASSFYYIVRGVVSVSKEEADEENGGAITVKQLSDLKAGDSFGEAVLTKDIPRPTTVKTLRRCQFLKIDKEPYQNIIRQNYEQSVHKRIELLSNVKILDHLPPSKLETLASLSKAVEFTSHTTILEEGNSTEDIYFISSGICNVMKKIKVVAIPLVQEGRQWKYRDFTSDEDMKPNEVLMQKTLHITDLRLGEYFGEEDLFTMSRRQALNEAFNHANMKNFWSIVSETKVECLSIPKVDFFRVLSAEEYDVIAKNYVKYPPMDSIISSFLVKCNWNNHKLEVIAELYQKKQRRKDLKASRY